MLVSKKWLQDFIVEPLPETEALVEGIIMHVFEVEEVKKVGDDEVLDIKVLPDRNHYALSHRGIAKDIAAIFSLTYKDSVPTLSLPQSKKLSVKIEDEKLCRRYMAARIENIKVGESPAWLKERLENVGQKSINNIVDATNYVMFNVGQPLHAFDADKVQGGIVARAGKAGEVLDLLDASGVADKKDRKIELGKGECVIADDSGPLVLAGIKGGVKTAISENTTNIILEAANFDPVVTRKFSTIYNLRSETSKRFENEITPDYAADGLRACIDLILKIAGGELEGVADIYPHIFPTYTVSVKAGDVKKVIGVDIPAQEIESILKRLQFSFVKNGDEYVVTAPSDRFDIRITEDMVEEIGRIYGYHHVQSRQPEVSAHVQTSKFFTIENIVRSFFLAQDFTEVYTYAFQSKGEVELANALAKDKSFVRKELGAPLASVLATNIHYVDLLGLSKIQIFEIGKVFKTSGEETHLGIAIAHAKKIKGTSPKDEITKLFAELLSKLSIPADAVKGTFVSDTVFEVNLDALVEIAPDTLTLPEHEEREVKKYQPISPYPFVVRDIAVWVPESVTGEEIETIIKTEAGLLLKRLSQFDVFSKDGKTSYAYRLVLQSMEKTLEEAEISGIMNAITTKMNAHEGWQVR